MGEHAIIQNITRGRYLGNGRGYFQARCHRCGGYSPLLVWGRSGPPAAPDILRRIRWESQGSRTLAVWRCEDCAVHTERKETA